ncbi:aminotransferase class I/II-fold pyridoxal phosphate-dependent enzyme [Alicyclobacillus dauci]|uniref:Aminotransferase n=1 Tax=Alicyclobacillus dauci TaxID=1475485 RepID=A0ABY6Z174_9BACL|nr:aminotransferase class I/II-fold pyridoxal phosphate-dependent enzyme [Alicyclobacillus dauci]WAH36630.1 aminotransferase class I/II-fold pyridoxal phosphate-dependent enzyme [Alicyclobacillus dauci]
MIEQSIRLQQLEDGVFQELALEKRRIVASGRDVIDLSVGSPDLPPSPHVMEALAQGVTDPNAYGYAITGLAEFNEAVAQFYKRYHVNLDPGTEVLQLMGSQDGLSHLALSLINPGETVLLPDPGYPIYEASVRLAGGIPYPLPINEDTLHPNFSLIPDDVLQSARLMILNYPSNPTAGVATRSMFEEVVRVAQTYDIFVIHDFAYSEMVYDGLEAVSLLSIPGAKDIAVEFNSLSKTFNMAGCRVGYLVGNKAVIGHLRKLKSHIDYGIFLPIQHAAITALTTDHDFAGQRQIYTARRDALCDALTSYGWEVRKPAATMFVWAKTPNNRPSHAFAMELLREAGVAVTPGAAFGPRGEGHVRMALVTDAANLRAAAERIGQHLAAKVLG